MYDSIQQHPNRSSIHELALLEISNVYVRAKKINTLFSRNRKKACAVPHDYNLNKY